MAADPLLAVEDEGRLNDPGLREAFVERLFAAARLRCLLTGALEPAGLVAFHTRHKLQLLAHDPGRYRSAGRVVARAGTVSPGETGAAYRELFLAAMASRSTQGRNANALQHAYSRIGRTLPQVRRDDLMARIEAYRRGEVPLSACRWRCSATTPAAVSCPGWPSRRTWRRSRPSCGCATRSRRGRDHARAAGVT